EFLTVARTQLFFSADDGSHGRELWVLDLVSTAFLSLTKTDGASQAIAGQPVTYVIQASNAGPDAALGASVVDVLPTALTGSHCPCWAWAGSSCGVSSGPGNIEMAVNLLAGGTATIVATATLDPSATGGLVNTASIFPPYGVVDPDLADNVATDVDTIVLPG